MSWWKKAIKRRGRQSLSVKGFQFLKEVEGFENKVYKDSAGHPTIGIGHKLTSKELESGYIYMNGISINWRNGLTDQQVIDLCDRDNDIAEAVIVKKVKVPLEKNQFDALVSFVFNVGIYAFKTSTLLKRLNQGHYDAVPYELQKWNKITVKGNKIVSKGLVNRRRKEVAMWRGEYVS